MNKNTKTRRSQIRAAGKAGESICEIKVPVRHYHSAGNKDDFRAKPDSFFTTIRATTAIVGTGGLVSQNKRRNMAMRVLINKNDKGTKDSLTVHEPATKGEYVTFKGHKYLREDESENGSNHYRQFKVATSRPVAA